MTTKEILQASLLDILFDNRNKDYGAYALRRNYNFRLLAATAGTLAIAFLIFLLMSFTGKNRETVNNNSGKIVVVSEAPTQVVKPKEPKIPEKKRIIPKLMREVAFVKLVNRIAIVPDANLKKTDMPDLKELENSEISNINSKGSKPDGIVRTSDNGNLNSNGDNTGTQKESAFKADEREPEFPGGQDALIRFLRNNLNTPDELEAGEKKMVQIRFRVGTDGTVSNLEILQSGGDEFDREVIRVCKKMPRWKPAFQNGTNVSVSYMLPVTFIGVEQ